jgi:hypothetical protein
MIARLRRFIFGAFAAVLGVTSITILFIVSGLGDPRPTGSLVFDEQPPDIARWSVIKGAPLADLIADGPILRVTAGDRDIRILAAAPVAFDSTGSIAIAIEQIDGATDAGFGLWWGASGDDYMAAAINGERYILVTGEGIDLAKAVMPWQPYPHVRGRGTENQLRAEITSQQTTIWLNNEVVRRFDGQPGGEVSTGGIFFNYMQARPLSYRLTGSGCGKINEQQARRAGYSPGLRSSIIRLRRRVIVIQGAKAEEGPLGW